MSVAAFTSRDEKLVGDAREDRFREERVGLGLVEH